MPYWFPQPPNKGGGSNTEEGVHREKNSKKRVKRDEKARAKGLPTRAEARAATR